MSGCSGTTVNLPVTSPTSAQGSVIDWGDGNTETLSASLQAHTYGTTGQYTVKYNGQIATFDTSGAPSSAQPCLKELRQWSAGAAPTTVSFKNSSNLRQTVQPPSSVTNYASLFENATAFNQDISGWDVSNVTNMQAMFYNAAAFNQSLSTWNTASVTRMDRTFADASAFNQNLSSWNVGLVNPKPPTSFDAYAGSWLLPRPNWT